MENSSGGFAKSLNKMFDMFRYSLRQLRTNKVRTALSTLGIVIGIASLVSIVNLGQGTEKRLVLNMENLGGASVLQVTVRRAAAVKSNMRMFLTDGDLDLIEHNVENIQYITPIIENWNALYKAGGRTSMGPLFGTTPSYLQIINVGYTGRSLSDADVSESANVCMIGDETAKELFGKTSPIGKSVLIQGTPFTVVGVLNPFTWLDMSHTVLIPVTSFRSYIEHRPGYSTLFVKTETGDLIPQLKIDVTALLKNRYHEQYNFQIVTKTEALKAVQKSALLLQLFLISVAGITLISGGIGIMNIQLASVMERTKMVGIKKVIGASDNDIFAEFIVEAALIGLLAGLIGVIFGVVSAELISGYISQFLKMDIQAVFRPLQTLGIVIFSVVISMVFGFVPALRAMRQDILNSLRSE